MIQSAFTTLLVKTHSHEMALQKLKQSHEHFFFQIFKFQPFLMIDTHLRFGSIAKDMTILGSSNFEHDDSRIDSSISFTSYCSLLVVVGKNRMLNEGWPGTFGTCNNNCSIVVVVSCSLLHPLSVGEPSFLNFCRSLL